MRLYTKYRTAAARKARSSRFQWLLVVLAGGFLIWVWWKNLQESTRTSPDQTLRYPVLRARDGVTNSKASVQARAALERGSPIGPRVPRNAYELQIALSRQGFSAGSLDGLMGSQTRAALRAFQERERLPITGALDEATKARLSYLGPLERQYTISADDLARLSPVGTTWLAKSVQDRLDYETILELVAEQAHAHPNLIRMLNPSVNWNSLPDGTTVRIPEVQYPPVRTKASWIRIRLRERVLQVFDRGTNILAHFPCSIAREVQKRPLGKLEVESIVLNPDYKFSPEIFPESEEARALKRPLMIPQGPNNPVGTAWIGLNRPGYGIHGTPRPEEVGRTESHGCFRLANWNAEYLTQLVSVGTEVLVEP